MYILVIGDVILDRYIYGHCPRLSPEAPVPVMLVDKTEYRAGGSANVAMNIKALGMDCELMSVVGQDAEPLMMCLNDAGVKYHLQQERIKTTLKTRYLSDYHHLLRIDSESDATPKDLELILNYYQERLNYHRPDYIIFSDYKKHFHSVAKKIIKQANAKGIPIAVDPKTSWVNYTGADLIAPNISEFYAEAQGRTISTVLKKHQIKSMLLTKGSDGMSFHKLASRKVVTGKAVTQEVVDVTGAGDTAISAFVVGKLRGYNDKECLDFANSASGVVCRKSGTAVAWIEETNRPEWCGEGVYPQK